MSAYHLHRAAADPGADMTTAHHAEHVGSLLRPPRLLRAREAREAGTLTEAGLRAVEDEAILELIALQREAGLRVFTDGEARRESWRAGLMESLDGVTPATRTMKWYRDGAELPRRRRSPTGWPPRGRCRASRTSPPSRRGSWPRTPREPSRSR
jgi:hypothetical protein